MEQTCPEKHFLDAISSETAEDLIPPPDNFGCIFAFANFAVTEGFIIHVRFADQREDLHFNPFTCGLHKVVEVVDNVVLDLELPRGPPAELE